MVINSIDPFVQYIYMFSFQISYQEHHWTPAHAVDCQQISYQYIENISKTQVIQKQNNKGHLWSGTFNKGHLWSGTLLSWLRTLVVIKDIIVWLRTLVVIKWNLNISDPDEMSHCLLLEYKVGHVSECLGVW